MKIYNRLPIHSNMLYAGEFLNLNCIQYTWEAKTRCNFFVLFYWMFKPIYNFTFNLGY